MADLLPGQTCTYLCISISQTKMYCFVEFLIKHENTSKQAYISLIFICHLVGNYRILNVTKLKAEIYVLKDLKPLNCCVVL